MTVTGEGGLRAIDPFDPRDFGYHLPDCAVTAEDNCTCDLPARLAAPAPDTLDVDIKTLRTALAATHSALHSGEGCYEAGEMHELISTTLFRLRGLDTEAGERGAGG